MAPDAESYAGLKRLKEQLDYAMTSLSLATSKRDYLRDSGEPLSEIEMADREVQTRAEQVRVLKRQIMDTEYRIKRAEGVSF